MMRWVPVGSFLLASLAPLAADIPPPQVEMAVTKDEMLPLKGKVLERFKQGFPPSISSYTWHDAGGFYEGEEKPKAGGAPSSRWTDSFVKFQWWYPFQPLKDSLPMVGGTEGLRVLRNAAGEIWQVQSAQSVAFVEREGTGWKVSQWAVGDTVPTPDAPHSRTPLPGKRPGMIKTLEELPADPQSGAQGVLERVKSFDGRYADQVTRHTYRSNEREAVSLTERYDGDAAAPANLVSRMEWTRTCVPGTDRYQQTIRREDGRNGRTSLVKHVTEIWRVAPDGSRAKVEERDHLQSDKAAREMEEE